MTKVVDHMIQDPKGKELDKPEKESGYMKVSVVKDAKLDINPKYSCPYCNSPMFHNDVAAWCINSDIEGGVCEYKLMSG